MKPEIRTSSGSKTLSPVVERPRVVHERGVAIVQLDGKITSTFGAFETTLGYDRGGTVGLDIHEVLANFQFPEQFELQRQNLRFSDDITEIEWTCVRQDGREFPARASISFAQAASHNDVTSIAIRIENIEHELKRNDRINFALENAAQGVWDVDINNGRVWYSDFWYKLRGLPVGQEVPNHHDAWVERLHPEDRDHIIEQIRVQNEERPDDNILEYREKHANGEYVWILSQGVVVETNPDGTAARVFGTDTDITELKRKEKQQSKIAQDFFDKSMAELHAAHDETKAAQELATKLANQDPLTGLPNRRMFTKALGASVERQAGSDLYRMLFFIDLDNFKPINDLYGHAAGDFVLCEIANRLSNSLRDNDIAVRLGGDEFAIMLERKELEQKQADVIIDRVAKRLIEAIEQPIRYDGHKLSISASIGIANLDQDGKTVDQIIHAADFAMYQAKQAGGGKSCSYQIDQDTNAKQLN